MSDGEPASDQAPGAPDPHPVAPAVEPRLLVALGRATHAFMTLRWEALWLLDTLARVGAAATARLARAETAVLALRLQSAAADATLDGLTHEQLRRWSDDFAQCADLQAEIQSAHPGVDGLWWSPDPETAGAATVGRAPDLLGHARRFEALAIEGGQLRRRLLG